MVTRRVCSVAGYSYFGLVPLANIVEGSLKKVLGRENDFSMGELHFKMEAFVKKYSVDEGYDGVKVLGVMSLWRE